MSSTRAATAKPRQTLSVIDGAAFLIGVVIGIGIFRLPQLVAWNVDSGAMFIGVWILGGLVMLVGALCYAELGSAHPDAGGEYHFLSRAYGQPLGVLFAWARGTVIQTGAIAAVAFVYGDYANHLIPLGEDFGPSIHALLGVLALTGLNLIGTPQSKRVQVTLVGLVIVSLVAIIIAGFASGAAPSRELAVAPIDMGLATIGLAMVFVLFTYGGWNETAYLSGEMRDVQHNMIRTLLLGTAVVTAIYVLANIAFLSVFGLQGLRESRVVGADLMQIVVGGWAATLLSLIVCVAALSTLNATIFTGARVYYALGRDLPALRFLGVWDVRGQEPSNALILQGAIALALVFFGAFTRDGLQTMIEYTAPVFFFFLFLVAISVIVFRQREPKRRLPYRLPFYPLPPIVFAAASAWMVYSTVVYAGVGTLVGIGVLLLGLPLLLVSQAKKSAASGRSRKR
jgi:amino acid transporter